MSATREQLISTMKQLLWERGYDATSPNHVLQRSGVGKGSFYHHFSSKKALAIAAMESRAEDLIAEFDALIASTKGDWLTKIAAYLDLPRDASKGCRMGRIVQDPSFEDEELLAPLQHYFTVMQQRLTHLYAQAQQQGELSTQLSAEALATLTLSVIQGSFVVGKATQQNAAVTTNSTQFMQLLGSLKNH